MAHKIKSIMCDVPILQHSSELDSRMNPHAVLYNPDATFQDKINGPITMQHLQPCIDASFTAATFCLQYIHSINARKECIQDLTTTHLCHCSHELHPVLTSDPANLSDTDDSNIEYIHCMQLTLSRTTNLVMNNLPPEMIHHFPHETPATFLSPLIDHEPDSLGHEFTLTILYAFKTLHLTHFLTNPAYKDATYKYMPCDSSDIFQNVLSFITTLQLFPNQSNFRDVPAFIHTFIQDQHFATNPFDKQQNSQRSSYQSWLLFPCCLHSFSTCEWLG
jgi:hypothetical protein